MATNLAAALQKLLPTKLPPSLSNRPGNLYQVLSRFPKDGVGQRVHQTRWDMKNIEGCYWEVTRTKLKLEGNHGKAWGKLYWKGKCVSDQDEKIPGGLKYAWTTGLSKATAKPKPPKIRS